MPVKDFIVDRVQAVPTALQWVYDPCGLAFPELSDATISVAGKSYHVLTLRPNDSLRFRRKYEELRRMGASIVVVSSDAPTIVSDIIAICRDGKKGNAIDCSPKAILESHPPHGTGKAWHDLVNYLGQDFAELFDSLVRLCGNEGRKLNPNIRYDAVRLLIAAKSRGSAEPRLVGRILGGRLENVDLYALARQFDQSTKGTSLDKLWREFCEEQRAASHTLFEKPTRANGYTREEDTWLSALESDDAHDEFNHYLCTTLVLKRYTSDVAALRPGVIGPDVEQKWTRYLKISDDEVPAFFSQLGQRYPKLFRSFASEYNKWLQNNPLVLKQLGIALGMSQTDSGMTQAQQVAEKENTFVAVFLSGLRNVAEALCMNPNRVANVSASTRAVCIRI